MACFTQATEKSKATARSRTVVLPPRLHHSGALQPLTHQNGAQPLPHHNGALQPLAHHNGELQPLAHHNGELQLQLHHAGALHTTVNYQLPTGNVVRHKHGKMGVASNVKVHINTPASLRGRAAATLSFEKVMQY
jgi:hypothetical protein